jgi:hypothetical protein
MNSFQHSQENYEIVDPETSSRVTQTLESLSAKKRKVDNGEKDSKKSGGDVKEGRAAKKFWVLKTLLPSSIL